MAYSIRTDINNIVFPANWEEGTDDNQEFLNRKEFKVIIDENEELIGGFRYDVTGDDFFDVIPNGNTFTVVARENFNTYERVGYVILHHNCIQGEDGEVTVYITQNAVECNISIEEIDNEGTVEGTTEDEPATPKLVSEINFLSLLYKQPEKKNRNDENNSQEATSDTNEEESDSDEEPIINKEVVELYINVEGGDKKYFIKSFKKFKRIDSNTTESVNTQNDRGIKVEKLDGNILRITNYGRTSLENGQYYELELAHHTNVKVTTKLKILYDDVDIKTDIPVIDTETHDTEEEGTRRSVLRKGNIKSNIKKHIPVFAESVASSVNYSEPDLTIYGLNAPIITYTKNGRKRTKKSDKEIVFNTNGGTLEYDINVSPKNAILSVKLNGTFVTYRIKNGKLILTAEPNITNTDRRGSIVLRHPNDPFKVISKTIIQKGLGQN